MTDSCPTCGKPIDRAASGAWWHVEFADREACFFASASPSTRSDIERAVAFVADDDNAYRNVPPPGTNNARSEG